MLHVDYKRGVPITSSCRLSSSDGFIYQHVLIILRERLDVISRVDGGGTDVRPHLCCLCVEGRGKGKGEKG